MGAKRNWYPGWYPGAPLTCPSVDGMSWPTDPPTYLLCGLEAMATNVVSVIPYPANDDWMNAATILVLQMNSK